MWWLIHSLTTRVNDVDAARLLVVVRSFIDIHFHCDECREHFLKHSVGEEDKIHSRRDVMLWFWRIHNEVNKRLAKDEAGSFSFDPAFPKVPLSMCATLIMIIFFLSPATSLCVSVAISNE